MLSAGAHVGDYEVWGRLGGGGMSEVYLARHRALAMPAVIRTLRPDLRASPHERARRMLTEARLMARIPSPYVVRAYDAGTHEDTPWMAQEYVDGVDLNELDHLRRQTLGRGLPLWFVCETMAQIAHALHAAHQHGVLHRDLKPSNLFGCPEIGVKLGDFGVAVAKRVGELGECDVSGTARFMPPEALRGQPLDRRSDIYELGATAFDLRYGHPPFPNPLLLLTSAPHPAFPAPTTPEEAFFQHVVARMLAYEPDARYRTVAEPMRLFGALAKSARRPAAPARVGDAIVFGATRIGLEAGDIARARADGIVSSANWEMKMRTGVGESLRRAGGDAIEAEAQSHGQQPLGACVVTGPGDLPCRKVLHAVSAWEQASCVGRATQRALLEAERHDLRTLAMPALGTGAAAVTLEACAAAMAAALRWHLALGGSRLTDIRLVLYDDDKRKVFRDVLEAALLGDGDPCDDHGLSHALIEGDEDRVSGEGPTYVAGSADVVRSSAVRAR
ncbi:MAG: serine/threonine-protein kinase [Deltaproteobacteria bacterium]|nr:serine/threonine-protein kinase [Deltaproteobacteria bacterium]